MRHLYFIITFSLLVVSCKDDTKTNKSVDEIKTEASSTSSPKTNTSKNKTNNSSIQKYLNNFKSLEDTSNGNPIDNFMAAANENNAKIIVLTKENVTSSFAKAKDYKHAYLIVKNHTIVTIPDFTDCKPSGSWGTCMPMGIGYIKKGAMQPKEDYINNIIGRPNKDQKLVLIN